MPRGSPPPIPIAMRQRTELLLAMATLIVLTTIVAIVAQRPAADRDRRASTLRTGPLGSKALYEATARLGVGVRRFRQRPQRLPVPDSASRTLLMILDPPAPLSPIEVASLVSYSAHADLLLAGRGTNNLMRCFGYQFEGNVFDSSTVHMQDAAAPRVSGTLVPTDHLVHRDSSRAADALIEQCTVPPMRSVTPLLGSTRGDVVLRLERADVDHTITLVADATLFRNRTMRETAAGPFALGLVVANHDAVIFDEYHQGYGASGSLGKEALAWSTRSPWGWAVWQLVGVGLLVLLAGAIRFGPIRRFRHQPRRSSLEHVRALATALSAADGHDEAIAAQVRGLRRRLAVRSMRARDDWRTWLDRLEQHATTPATANAIAEVQHLTTPGQPRTSVLRTAHAVEDVWKSLQP